MKKLFTASITASLILASGIAAAAAATTTETPLNDHKGFYVEANAGTNAYYGVLFGDKDHSATGGMAGFGWSVDTGYSFNRIVSVEAGFMQNRFNPDSFDIKDIDPAKNYIHVNSPYLAGRFNIPLGDRFAIITKAGLMYISATGQNDDDKKTTNGYVAPFLGVGLGFAVTKNIDLNVQYQGASIVIAGAGLLSGGMTYHF